MFYSNSHYNNLHIVACMLSLSFTNIGMNEVKKSMSFGHLIVSPACVLACIALTFWVKSSLVYVYKDKFLQIHLATTGVYILLVKESNRSSNNHQCLHCDSADFPPRPVQMAVSFLFSLFLCFTHKLQRQHLFAENQYCLGL